MPIMILAINLFFYSQLIMSALINTKEIFFSRWNYGPR